jgi:hypothetical protein
MKSGLEQDFILFVILYGMNISYGYVYVPDTAASCSEWQKFITDFCTLQCLC